MRRTLVLTLVFVAALGLAVWGTWRVEHIWLRVGRTFGPDVLFVDARDSSTHPAVTLVPAP